MAKGNSGEIPMGFHAGRIVQYLAAIYGRLDQVVGELVQNFLDARAKEATIYINIRERMLWAWDNGEGATMKEMSDNFALIGAPRKEKLVKKKGPLIGRRSIGNLAPIALKGEKSVWTFMSHKPGSTTSNRWYSLTLDMKGLENRKELGLAPNTLAGFKPTDPKGTVLLGVSTMVQMTDVEIGHFIDLVRVVEKGENPAVVVAHGISEVYSATLLKSPTKIVVHVIDQFGIHRSDVVKPQRFPGEKREMTIDGVAFEIYVTRNSQKKSRLFVEHEEQVSFPLSNQKDLWDLVNPVLGSGHFQGIVRTSLCELTPNRTKFVFGPQYDRFADAVISFVTNHAEPWLNEIRAAAQEDRVAKTIEDVLEKVAPLVNDFPELAEVFRAAKNPVGHPTTEDQEEGIFHPEVTPHGHGEGEGGEQKKKKRKSPAPSPTPPAGQKIVRGGRVMRHASGLAIKRVTPAPTDPWGIKWRARIGDTALERGLLLINQSHPDFLTAHNGGDASRHTYILLITLGVMAGILSRNEEKTAIFRDVFETYFLTISGPLIPRIPSFAKHKKRVKE